MTEEQLYNKTFQKKILDLIKNKFVINTELDHNGQVVVYYITGSKYPTMGLGAPRDLEGYVILMNSYNEIVDIENLENYNIGLEKVVYSAEIENEETLEKLNNAIAKKLLAEGKTNG